MNPFSRLFCRGYQICFRLALPLLPYRQPELLTAVTDIPSLLQREHIGRVLLITDAPLRALGLTQELEKALSQAGIACAVYDGVVPNPTVDNVEQCRALYLESGAQAMIAFGGGSPMDCAKAAGARIARPQKAVQAMGGLLKVLRKTPLLIAVPTTAGTGSETTLAAVITDPATHYKYPINDFALIPDAAVLDYHVTLGLPKQITATTGMDALTHAVEAYIGRSTTKLTRAMAEEAVTLIAKYLLRAYRDGQDAEARTQMLQAAYDAGIAFTRSYVGYVHGVAHSLGGQYGVPHGLANAVILPYFLEEYGPSCHKALARLARKAGIAEETSADEPAARAFIAWVWEMNRAMEIPSCTPEIRAADIPALAAHAAKESNPLYPVPKLMDARELETMYYKLMPKEDTP
ncbi:iron-containing alcohol dehydrogenase [bacterium 210917-DFI.7.65]|nr:iron-containing alcohol dehydrogenase [bacterium 210917-DFI.7.65]